MKKKKKKKKNLLLIFFIIIFFFFHINIFGLKGIMYYFMIFTEIPWGEATLDDSYYQSFLCKGKDYFPYLEDLTPESIEGLLRILDPNPKTRITLDKLIKSNWIQGIQSCGSTNEYNSHGPSPSGIGHHHVILHI